MKKSKQHIDPDLEFGRVHDEMDKILTKSGIRRVRYSAYKVKDDLPINNLNEVAQEGRVVVVSENGVVFPPILNPTWLQLCDMANSATDEDADHTFFEGIKDIDTNKYFTTIQLCMGS